tara:strand:- start:49 stop:252 length:204 start_codon:yes stop_codon:yes gene_type:complete
MKLIPDWKQAHKWFSVQLAAVSAALPLAWEYLPSDLKAYIPDEWRPAILAAVGLAIIVGRILDQKDA